MTTAALFVQLWLYNWDDTNTILSDHLKGRQRKAQNTKRKALLWFEYFTFFFIIYLLFLLSYKFKGNVRTALSTSLLGYETCLCEICCCVTGTELCWNVSSILSLLIKCLNWIRFATGKGRTPVSSPGTFTMLSLLLMLLSPIYKTKFVCFFNEHMGI